ncbi:adenylosuccinate synthase [Catalinimonas niigatensis]|uniref:adenylosuccinate synthase n=1 Tax=Catalinimonas niigatensis TaxID=1397264 RepID=UPI00266649EF|nr:adenylosuccinate synthase [Catalinimonas niigatensis]WPP49902.1 adenylosuccinate synthase [Catalinimonas niigatensis]
MKVDVLLGLQWGDEGKGKIVDYLAPKYKVVARFQGGPNAGHTLEFDNIKHVLHQIPSGIFRQDIMNIIGNGVVLDPITFKKEIEGLKSFDLDLTKNLFISKKAQIILPSHRLLDAAYEKAKGKDKIGSTLKGIGPAYQDKIGRNGLRVGDVLSSTFKERYDKLVEEHKRKLSYFDAVPDMIEQEKDFFEGIELLKTYNIVDSEYLINQKIRENVTVLAEGAQGSLLDVDFGSYPFVTSSTTIASGACTGLGVAPRNIGSVLGIFKAYCTRVGSGPFPTELNDEVGEILRKNGNEFGATTGRPRRCGWLDLPALKYAVMINGASELFMMKADVLNDFEEIKVCTHYQLENGDTTDHLPYDICHEEIVPIYKTFKGWNTSLGHAKHFDELPYELMMYIKYVEDQLGVPINLISTGPNRTQTVIKE